jgi:hypothetical protein
MKGTLPKERDEGMGVNFPGLQCAPIHSPEKTDPGATFGSGIREKGSGKGKQATRTTLSGSEWLKHLPGRFSSLQAASW